MPVSEYDQRILGITKELCLQLNIADYNPIFVSWEGFDSRSRVQVEFRYDECLIERRLRVVADEKAADVVSTTSFLTALYKVSETMGQTGFRANRTIRGPIPLLPDIQTRIARLKKKSAEL